MAALREIRAAAAETLENGPSGVQVPSARACLVNILSGQELSQSRRRSSSSFRYTDPAVRFHQDFRPNEKNNSRNLPWYFFCSWREDVLPLHGLADAMERLDVWHQLQLWSACPRCRPCLDHVLIQHQWFPQDGNSVLKESRLGCDPAEGC